nr:MAG TPA: hypothetical protein [Bacteriophage sp.]
MELWIRSQYGSLLEKAEAIKIANYDGTIGIVINNDYVFGEYKTKERALEVLDEIEKLIKPITIFQNCQVDKSTIEKIKKIGYCMVNSDARVEQISQAFYQMPED